MKKFFCIAAPLLLFTFVFSKGLHAQSAGIKQVKLTDFDLQSSSLIKENGETISLPGYHSGVYWFPVKVPTTVLRGLVTNNIYPDPYLGLNNMLIPDASDQFNKEYNLEQYSYLPNEPNPWKKPYWYRTTFKVPAGDHGKHFQLLFKGINYRAAVWLNGKQIADSTQLVGMFAEHSINVSAQIDPGAENALAVKIYPSTIPGIRLKNSCRHLARFLKMAVQLAT